MGSGVGVRWPWIALVALGVLSCELAVPQANLDEVRCQQEGQVGPPACPDGKTCVAGRCALIGAAADAGQDGDVSVDPPNDAAGGSAGTGGSGAGGTGAGGTGAVGGAGGTDASVEAGGTSGDGGTGGVPVDAAEEPFVKRPLGEPCGSPAECESAVCLEVPESGGQKRCALYCCSSYNCPTGSVCSTFWGSQLCVNPTSISLSIPGAAAGPAGATCGDGSQCRSGRCGTDGKCKDVCCVNDSCPNGGACALTAEFGQAAWYCAGYTAGTHGGNAAGCTSASNCDSNLCYDYGSSDKCNGPCCKDADCSAFGWGAFCDYKLDGSTAVRQCFSILAVAPSEGQACCNDSNCEPGQHCVAVNSDVVSPLPLFPDQAWVFRCQ